MTPYGDRHQRNEYSLGTVATAEVAEAPEPETADAGPPAEDDADDDDEDADFVCAECGRVFATQHGLKIHLGKAHQ